MPYNTFTPPITPDHEMVVDPTQEINESNFGEYVQRGEIGINTKKFYINPQWTNLYAAEANAILNFFKAQGRTAPFYYTAPNEPQRLYYCDSFPYKWRRGNRCDIGPCKFVEVKMP